MKIEQEHTIEVVFERYCAQYGFEVVNWLEDTGIAKRIDHPADTSDVLNCYAFIAMQEIAADSVIVFVSDEATANRDWFNRVKAVPDRKRIIPVGSIESADYNNPEVLPSRIEEINFIRLDENLLANIKDSLTTDPDFYTLKNHLLLKCKRWVATYDTGNLLTNTKKIRFYTAIATKKIREETDPKLKAQLSEIIGYLKKSWLYARKIRRQSITRWLFRCGAFALAIALLIGYFKFKAYYKKLNYANLASSFDMNTVDNVTGAIKMAEVLSNPLSAAASKKLAFENLVDLLDKVWDQTPIGRNYRNSIYDVAIPLGSRYVWTADSGGRAICWDTYTGELSRDQKITDFELVGIAISKSNDTIVAVDNTGKIYVEKQESWSGIGLSSSINTFESRIKVTDNVILLFDDHNVEVIDVSGKMLLSEHKNCQVLAADFLSDSEIIVAESGNNILIIETYDYVNRKSETRTYDNIALDTVRGIDILDGLLVVADQDGQVWKVVNNSSERTALLLPMVIDLKLVNKSTVVYHERNMGTGIYDIEEDFDYGDVLSDLRGINNLYASDMLVAGGSQSGYYVYSIANILKSDKSEIIMTDDTIVYDKSKVEMDLGSTNQSGIQSAQITDNGVIILGLKLSGDNAYVTAYLDPARVINNSSGHQSQDDAIQIPEEALTYDNEPFCSNGVPTVVGVRYEPANEYSDQDRYFLVVGCTDGSFSEIYIDPNGATLQTVSHVIPSRCAIKAIYQLKNEYVIEDIAGRMWKCSDGVGLVVNDGYLRAIQGKLHSAVTDELKELISSEVWNALGLRTHRGGSDVMWE